MQDNREMFFKFEEELDAIITKERTMGIRELATQLIEERGIEIGMEKGQTTFVTNLLLKTDHSLQQIAELADVSIDFVIEVKNNLPSNPTAGK
jgi:hypothetical protein